MLRRRIHAAAVVMALALVLSPPSWAVTGDLDNSGLVDGWDLISFAQAFGTAPVDPKWNGTADFDSSGRIDGSDMAVIVGNFGRNEELGVYSRLNRANGPQYLADQIVVKFVPEMGASDIETRTGSLGGSVRQIRPHYVTVGIDPATDSVEQAVNRFKSDPQVVYAEPDHLRYLQFRPNDPFFPEQWGNRIMDYESGLDIQAGSASNVIIAVIDTGVAYEDFQGFRKATDLAGTRFVAGPDLVGNDGHPNDEGGDGFGHGTFVTTIIAATTNNNFGMAGVAFNATIMPIRVFGRTGGTPDSIVAAAIDAAVDGGAKIINMSLGGPGFSITLQDACRRAYNRGVTQVAAAGNEANDPDFNGDADYPAAFPEVIGVAATNMSNGRASYSNPGPSVDVAAPGGDFTRDDDNDGQPDGILGQSFDNNQYTRFQFFIGQGTSFSTPYVSALAALLYARGVTHPDAIANTIYYSAVDAGPDGEDNDLGFGVANFRRALEGLGPD